MAKAHADNGQHKYTKEGATVEHKLGYARVHSGTPAAEVDDEIIEDICNPTGSRPTHLTTTLNDTNDGVTSKEKSRTAFIHGTRDCTVANTAYPLAATSTPVAKVQICAREANAGICITGGSTLTTAGGPCPKISVGCRDPIGPTDLALIYVASSNAGDDVDFDYETY